MKVYFEWNQSPEPDIAGYKIYAGKGTSGVYNDSASPKDVGNVLTAFYDISQFGAPPWFFALTAYNATGQESTFSAEIQVTMAWPVAMMKKS